ncbi:MAG TPA: hypothetical protein VGJ38_04200 [Jatrophihabitantaceae bacterium]|jgi:hypothetical protein
MALRTGAWSGSMRGGGVHQGRPSFHGDGPATFLEFAMVVAAEQTEIVDVRASTVDPAEDVMGLGPARWSVAAGKAASAVTGGKREPLPGARDATTLPEREHALGVDHDGHDLRLAGDSQGVGD